MTRAITYATVGDTIAGHLISLLSSGATLITCGAIAQETIPLHASAVFGSEIGIRGLTIGRWLSGVAPERRASDIASVNAIAIALSAEFDIAGTYMLDQIADAVQHVARPGKNGTVMVKI